MTSISIKETYFDNEILGVAAAAAVGALQCCSLTPQETAQAIRSFVPLPHRMSVVTDKAGVTFVDDSKATSLAAMGAALDMCRAPVRLIAGGRLKEHDLRIVREVLGRRVRAAYLIGDASVPMAEAWGDMIPCHLCGTLERAVRKAWDDATAGERVLLSPGCASFDQFDSFEDRGNQFISTVRSLHEKYNG